LSIATELEAFRVILDFSSSQAHDPKALVGRTTDLVSAIEWGLFDGPELVDSSHLLLVSDGVMQLIQDLGDIAKSSQTEEAGPESEYALYKICDWRAQSKDIIGSWLSGWWTHDGGGETEKPSLLVGLSDGFRVLQFAGWWLWVFHISLNGNHLRRHCGSVTIVAPPASIEEPGQPPLYPDPAAQSVEDGQPQKQCNSVDELAALLGVKFGEACPGEVMHAYQTRLEYASWDTDIRWDLARCYARQRDYPQAIKAYEEVLQEQPEFHEARKELILCLAALQQWDAAEAEARYLRGFTLMRPDARLALGCLQSLRNQTPE